MSPPVAPTRQTVCKSWLRSPLATANSAEFIREHLGRERKVYPHSDLISWRLARRSVVRADPAAALVRDWSPVGSVTWRRQRGKLKPGQVRAATWQRTPYIRCTAAAAL